MTKYLYIFMTIFFMAYSQLILKWQLIKMDMNIPASFHDKILVGCKLLLNPWVASSFLAVFLASLTWIAVLAKLPLSYAYPFMSLSFVSVCILSKVFFHEELNIQMIIGLAFIVLGVVLVGKKL